jgi:hypothetical protein
LAVERPERRSAVILYWKVKLRAKTKILLLRIRQEANFLLGSTGEGIECPMEVEFINWSDM